jgi:hypothetical protein
MKSAYILILVGFLLLAAASEATTIHVLWTAPGIAGGTVGDFTGEPGDILPFPDVISGVYYYGWLTGTPVSYYTPDLTVSISPDPLGRYVSGDVAIPWPEFGGYELVEWIVTPEPATALLLGGGILWMLRRRNR